MGNRLYDAAHHGDINLVKSLLNQGYNINEQDSDEGITPLHLAAWFGHIAIAELLVTRGADINMRNNYGKTPLHDAAEKGYTNIVELLLDKGANVNMQEFQYSNTPAHLAAFFGHGNIVRLLVDKGADLTITDIYNHTPSQCAAKNGKTRIVELLREQQEKKEQREQQEKKEQREQQERIKLAEIAAKEQREQQEKKEQREQQERIKLAEIAAKEQREQQEKKEQREQQERIKLAEIAAKEQREQREQQERIKLAEIAAKEQKEQREQQERIKLAEIAAKEQREQREQQERDKQEKIKQEAEKLYNKSIAEQTKENYDQAFDLANQAYEVFPSEKIKILQTTLTKRIKNENNFKKFMDAGQKSHGEYKYENSLEEYQKALEMKRDDQLCNFGVCRARAYIHQELDPTAAITYFEQALALKPHDTDCSIQISKLLMKSNEFEKALSYLEPLSLRNQEIDQLKCELYTEKGIKSYNNENYKEADSFFQKALEYSEGDNKKLVLINLAWCCLGEKELDKLDKSISYLEAAQKLNPQDENIKDIMSLVFNRRGEEYLEQGNNRAAEESFKKATELLKDNIYQNNLCTAYLNQKSYKAALEASQNIEGQETEYFKYISTRTNILEMLTQNFHVTKEEKEKYHAQLTELHPQSSKYLHQHAKFLVDHNYEPTIYVPIIKQGLVIDPNNTDLIGLATDQGMEL
ncbi:ankyrin repeat domain-containing protein [Candidatus Tisiphia endosymbiont of Ptychoptera albimana]|uniref:ankyrin repeat domain-containing protein n=1 Tax=Candidatus Tisiphia endosymbiont of Ptychoptera albimana TaxID=3066260 RepID=UPI00312CA011